MQPNKQVVPKTNKHKPTKGKETRTCQRPKSKQASMDLKQEANKTNTFTKELTQTLCCKLGFIDIDLDH